MKRKALMASADGASHRDKLPLTNWPAALVMSVGFALFFLILVLWLNRVSLLPGNWIVGLEPSPLGPIAVNVFISIICGLVPMRR